jgi:hypothetical protein
VVIKNSVYGEVLVRRVLFVFSVELSAIILLVAGLTVAQSTNRWTNAPSHSSGE